MTRIVMPFFVALSFVTFVPLAFAQDQNQQLETELDELESGEAATCARVEIERARELLRLAAEAESQGQTTTAQSVLSLVPLQLRLIREIVLAARLEGRADELEARLIEQERARQVAREALERVLERLIAMSPMWNNEGHDDGRP